MKRFLPYLLIALVAVTAAGMGTWFYRVKVAQLTPASRKIGHVPDAKSAHVRGSATAAVTLEEFGDFQCPPCGMIAPILLRLESDFDRRLRVVFHNFPLDMHAHAAEAARAAEAAGLQGKFWPMHDLLFAKQEAWSKEKDVASVFRDYAKELGLDLDRFASDYAGAEVRMRIGADQARGKSLGVESTPTLFVNGQALPPTSLNEGALRAAIEAALRGESPVPPTPSPTVTPRSLATPAASPLSTASPQP